MFFFPFDAERCIRILNVASIRRVEKENVCGYLDLNWAKQTGYMQGICLCHHLIRIRSGVKHIGEKQGKEKTFLCNTHIDTYTHTELITSTVLPDACLTT